MDLPSGPFGAILADPPWRFATWSERGRGRCPDGTRDGGPRHYSTLPLAEILALPIAQVAAPDCALFLWVPKPLLPTGLAVGAAWGFTFKTRAFLWVKRTRSGRPHMGLGHWTRANPEDCFLFTRGHPRRLSRGVRELIEAPVREHSRKPDETYDRIEQLVGGPYLELFARTDRAGWVGVGDEQGRWMAL